MEFHIKAEVGVELEESVGTSTAGITEIITVT
jgi:hypothetical protein